MHTITFYSFKGGVGRTMALVNVGLELVRRGRRVLLVDFDLEAPGLSTYSVLQGAGTSKGIVEYVDQFVQQGAVPDVRDFSYEVDVAHALRSRRKRSQKRVAAAMNAGGRLWVMPAGRRDESYGPTLGRINWQSLYAERDGYLFFEDTKRQWDDALRPNYVLIDSRTGHTDVGGICTRQLADAVVLLFFPNEENRTGLQVVAHDIRTEIQETRRPIRMHLVMSNVPNLDDEERILRRQRYRFVEALGVREMSVIHRYESLMHLEQRAFVLERPHSRLARQYRKLTQRLILGNPRDRDAALIRLSNFRQALDTASAERRDLMARSRKLEQHLISEGVWASLPHEHIGKLGVADQVQPIVEYFADDRQVLVESAKVLVDLSDFEKAGSVLDRVISLGDTAEARVQRSRVRYQLKDVAGAIEDLIAVIRAGDAAETVIIDAVRDLSRLDCNRLQHRDVRERIRQLSPGGKLQIVAFVATRDDRFELAVELLGSALESVERPFYDPTQYHRQLACFHLYRHEWSCARSALDGEFDFSTRRYRILTLFLRGMADWGEWGTFPKAHTEEIVRLRGTHSSTDSYPADCFAMAMVYGRAREHGQATSALSRAISLSRKLPGPTMSYWRCRMVHPDEFREDCEELQSYISRGQPEPRVIRTAGS